MKLWMVVSLMVLLVACSGKTAVRVDCERRLIPINVPAPLPVKVPIEAGPIEEATP